MRHPWNRVRETRDGPAWCQRSPSLTGRRQTPRLRTLVSSRWQLFLLINRQRSEVNHTDTSSSFYWRVSSLNLLELTNEMHAMVGVCVIVLWVCVLLCSSSLFWQKVRNGSCSKKTDRHFKMVANTLKWLPGWRETGQPFALMHACARTHTLSVTRTHRKARGIGSVCDSLCVCVCVFEIMFVKFCL